MYMYQKISELVNWLLYPQNIPNRDLFDLEASLETDALEENNKHLWRPDELTSSRLELSNLQPTTNNALSRFTNSINLEVHSCDIVISNSNFFSSLVPGEMCKITGGYDFLHGFHSNILISPNPKEIIEDLSGNTENSIKVVLPVLSYVCAKYYLYTIGKIFTLLTEKIKNNNKESLAITRGLKLFEEIEFLYNDFNHSSLNDFIDQKIVDLEKELENTSIQLIPLSQYNYGPLIIGSWLSIIIFFIVIQQNDIKANHNKIQETIFRLKMTEYFKELQKIILLDQSLEKDISGRLSNWLASFNRVITTGENLTFSISKSENHTIAKCYYPDMFSLHQEWTVI